MRWILVLYWTMNGQPVMNHLVFTAQAPCEERIVALRKVFESLDHPEWSGVCQPEQPTQALGRP